MTKKKVKITTKHFDGKTGEELISEKEASVILGLSEDRTKRIRLQNDPRVKDNWIKKGNRYGVLYYKDRLIRGC